MFYRFFSHIKFLLESTNQHGVHSPFVFNFVTKGLYKRGKIILNFSEHSELKNLSKKKKKILSKVLNYFKIDSIYFDSKLLNKELESKSKLLYIKLLNHNFFLENQANYFVIIENIHKNKNAYSIWQKIIKNNEATVTIDLFYFGLIFFRKEQAKEHFKIRV